MLKARTHFPHPPTEDLEVTALPVGACSVGRQAEVVAGILGKDWLDPQGALGQNLQPRTGGKGCHGDQHTSETLPCVRLSQQKSADSGLLHL